MEQSTEQSVDEPTAHQPAIYHIHVYHDDLIQRLDRLIALLEAQRAIDIETITMKVIERIQTSHRRL